MIKQVLRFTFGIIAALACLFSLTGLFGSWGEFFDLTSHFYLFYLPIEITAVIILFWARAYRWALAVFLLSCICIFQILPFYFSGTPQAVIRPAQKIRVLQFNTWASNQHPELIASVLSKVHPDFAALEEISAPNYHALLQTTIIQAYPYRAWAQAARLLLLSRYPFKTKPEFDTNPITIQVTAEIEKQPISLVMTHTTRPMAGSYRLYCRQMETLIQRLNRQPKPLIIMGDLNTGPWSSSFQQLLKNTQLRNTQIGQGIQPTYPYHIPKTQIVWPFPVLPLDHVLVSHDIQVLHRWNGPYGGSDHLPVVVELDIARERAGSESSYQLRKH